MRDRNSCPAQREVSCVNCCQEEMIPFKDGRKNPMRVVTQDGTVLSLRLSS